MKLKINLTLLTFLIFLVSKQAFGQFVCTTKQNNILRSSPSAKSTRLKVLARYTPLKVIEKVSSWYEVKGYHYKGFIHESLVTDKYKCMTLLVSADPYCPGKSKKLKRVIAYRESFKILKQEIACNYIQGKWGRKSWLSSLSIWPQENAKRIDIP